MDDAVSIRLGNGNGTFTSAPDVPVGPNQIFLTVGHFNSDSNLDLAVPNQNDNDVSIRLGNGDGTFTTPTISPPDVPVGSLPQSITVGDFNN